MAEAYRSTEPLDIHSELSLFIRNNMTGRPSLKTKAMALFKTIRPDTSFYDDLHEIYRQLRATSVAMGDMEQRMLRNSAALEPVIAMGPYAVLSRAGELSKHMLRESVLVPRVWQRYVAEDYKLPTLMARLYTSEQLEYRPFFMPGEGPESERPFMTHEERKEDDLIRAQRRAREIGVD